MWLIQYETLWHDLKLSEMAIFKIAENRTLGIRSMVPGEGLGGGWMISHILKSPSKLQITVVISHFQLLSHPSCAWLNTSRELRPVWY